MPIEYWFDADRQLLVTRAAGRMTDSEILGYMRRLTEDTSWPSGADGFVDAREIEGFEVTSEAIGLASLVATEREDRFSGSRWAVVTDLDAVFGMTRMYTIRRDPESYEVGVFRDVPSALAWLGRDGFSEAPG